MNLIDEMSAQPAKACLLFSSREGLGVRACLADFFSSRGLLIEHHVEFVDDGQLFSRLQWRLDERWLDESEFEQDFAEVIKLYQADFTVRFMNRKQTLGLFVSTKAHCLIDILNKVEARFFPEIEIGFIVGNDEAIRKVADRHAVPFFHVATGDDALAYEKKQLDLVQRYKPDYLGLAGYEKILSANFVSKVRCPIISIRPSFIPSFITDEPYQMAYQRGVKLIGATASYVSAELDQGPIIEQGVKGVKAGASVDDMIKMGRAIEQTVFAQALLKILEYKVIRYKNRTIVFD